MQTQPDLPCSQAKRVLFPVQKFTCIFRIFSDSKSKPCGDEIHASLFQNKLPELIIKVDNIFNLTALPSSLSSSSEREERVKGPKMRKRELDILNCLGLL